MAVLEELGVEVNIEVAGNPATEYPDPEHNANDDENGPPKNVHYCYIESQEKEEFCITFRITKTKAKTGSAAKWLAAKKDNCLGFHVFLDGGDRATSRVCREPQVLKRIPGITDHANDKVYHFRFSSVSTGMYISASIER